MLKFLMRGAILALVAFSLTACASGSFNGLSKDPMHMMVVHKNPLYGEMTRQDYALTVKLANSCKTDADRQMASVFETAATSGGANAIGGAALGPAAKAGFGGAVRMKDYTPYGAIANGAAGVVQGVQMQSVAKTAVVGSCTNGDLQDPLARRLAPGMHAYPSYVRTNNSSKGPPSWTKPAGAAPAAPATGVGEDSYTAPAPPPPM